LIDLGLTCTFTARIVNELGTLKTLRVVNRNVLRGGNIRTGLQEVLIILPEQIRLETLDLAGHEFVSIKTLKGNPMLSLTNLDFSTNGGNLSNLNLNPEDFYAFPKLKKIVLGNMDINDNGVPINILKLCKVLSKSRPDIDLVFAPSYNLPW
jgi:Leucine-rich repeat (LRR) protein